MKKEITILAVLIIACILCSMVLLGEAERGIKKIDENGGLKAVFERVWVGNPTESN